MLWRPHNCQRRQDKTDRLHGRNKIHRRPSGCSVNKERVEQLQTTHQLNYRCHCPPAGSAGMAGTVVYGIHSVAWRLPRNRKLNINSYSSIVCRYHLTGWTGAVRAHAAAPAATGSMPPTATHRQPRRSGLSRALASSPQQLQRLVSQEENTHT